ncbi:spore germination protein [Blautia schinkii]|nr:spore germination protein [Blautia schinkii]
MSRENQHCGCVPGCKIYKEGRDDSLADNTEKTRISQNLRENEKYIRKRCENCDDILIRPMKLGDERKVDCLMVYIEVAVSNMMLDDSAIGKMVNHFWEISPDQIQEFVENNSLGIADVKKFSYMEDAFAAMLAGNAIFFIDGFDEAMKISSKGYPSMGVSEAETEKVLRGSKEGFSDGVKTNSALVRKRLRDTRLKVVEHSVGTRSNTMLQMLYIDDLVREEFLEDVKERLDSFEIDGILDSGMLEQLTEDTWYSPFPQYQTTERPDRAAQELLNGKIVLLCDNSPVALILPGAFNSFMESSEDWYNRFEMASFLRLLRYLAMLAATLLPGLYLAVIRFHTQILPTNLILSFAEAREGVPFSSVVELVFLELSFELIREAGVRIPGALGNAIGIVGGLIIGQAAVEANLVSPIVVMIVALTALGSLAIPNEEFASAFRLLKYFFLFLGGYLGIYGIVLGAFLTVSHLAGLLSFGVPYLVPFVKKEPEKGVGSGILRIPFNKRYQRPIYAKKDESVRLKRREKQ